MERLGKRGSSNSSELIFLTSFKIVSLWRERELKLSFTPRTEFWRKGRALGKRCVKNAFKVTFEDLNNLL